MQARIQDMQRQPDPQVQMNMANQLIQLQRESWERALGPTIGARKAEELATAIYGLPDMAYMQRMLRTISELYRIAKGR